MKAYERLLKYAVIRTPSDEDSTTVPSSECQFDLARLLEEEMKELGLTDVRLTDQCYLYGKLPATAGLEDKPAIGFIAHMDTVSDFCDHEIRPMITENYDGEDLALGDSGLILSPVNFPHLRDLKGRTLSVSRSPRTKKSEAGLHILMWNHSAQIMPTPSTATRKARSSTRASMPAKHSSTSRASTFTQVPPRIP